MSLQFTHVHSFVCRLKTIRYETCERVVLLLLLLRNNNMATNLKKVHFKLRFTIVNALFCMWLLTSDIFDRWCNDTVTQWGSQPKIFLGDQKIAGAKMFDFRRATVFFWNTASQSKKWLFILKVLGVRGPLRDVVSYCVKRSMNESVAVLPYVWNIHCGVRLCARPVYLSK